MHHAPKTSRPKTAIITGASSGIGLAITQALLGQGYRVVANSRSISKSKILQNSEQLVLVDGDIGSADVATKIVRTAVEKFGSIDLLVNNAGRFIARRFTDYTAEDFESMLSTNLAGFFHVSRQTVVQMRQQKHGHIVNVTAALVSQPDASVAAALASLTKGGLQAVSKALAIEYAGEGIRFNAIAPGVVDTALHANDDHEFMKSLNPMHRLAHVSEIADALTYLEAATFVTGEVIHVDGGTHAGRW